MKNKKPALEKMKQMILIFIGLLLLPSLVQAMEFKLNQDTIATDLTCSYIAENSQYGVSNLNIDLYLEATECSSSMKLFFNHQPLKNKETLVGSKDCKYAVQTNKYGVKDLNLDAIFKDKNEYQCPSIMMLILKHDLKKVQEKLDETKTIQLVSEEANANAVKLEDDPIQETTIPLNNTNTAGNDLYSSVRRETKARDMYILFIAGLIVLAAVFLVSSGMVRLRRNKIIGNPTKSIKVAYKNV